MASPTTPIVTRPLLLLPLWLLAAGPYAAGEVISDFGDIVGPSPGEEKRALEIKAENFWKTVLAAAEEMKMVEHLDAYAEADRIIAELPTENEFVRKGLSEAVERLRRADQMVLKQAVPYSDLAFERLSSAPGSASGSSFLAAGQNFLKTALQRFVAGGRYPERLMEHVEQRQADILPVLQGVAGATGNVLDDTRLGSKLSFDVLKYDIYNKGVPKTPQAAKDVAYKLVDASGETRHRFMQFITRTVNGITIDFQGRSEDASATIARSMHSTIETQVQASPSEQIFSV